MRPIVALLTDFGTQDHYVGAVKGAVLTVCADVQLVDLTHDVPPQDVATGAFALAASYRAFPAGAVFVAVVDPGVGTSRLALALEAGGYLFVGPDNGLFTLVLQDHPSAVIRAVTNAGLFREPVSRTFHARDVFGPVAGHLAGGTPLDSVGPPAKDPVLLPIPRAAKESECEWRAEVVYIDRYGNLTTSFTADDLKALRDRGAGDLSGMVAVVAGVVLPVVETYADVAAGEACALVGSSNRLEISVNRGSAAKAFGLEKGSPVRLRLAEVVL